MIDIQKTSWHLTNVQKKRLLNLTFSAQHSICSGYSFCEEHCGVLAHNTLFRMSCTYSSSLSSPVHCRKQYTPHSSVTITNVTEIQVGMHSPHILIQLNFGSCVKFTLECGVYIISCHGQYPPVAKYLLLLKINFFHISEELQGYAVLDRDEALCTLSTK
jgi:hypothetical protein